MAHPHDFHEVLAQFARDMRDETTTDATVDLITSSIVEQIDGALAAGASLVDKRSTAVQTLGATHPVVEKADQLQVELGEGPDLDLLVVQEIVHAPDLATDARWPRWAPAAVEQLDLRSMLSVQLLVNDGHVGALTLYARTPRAFTTPDIAEVGLWASHAAVALAAAQKIDQLESAVLSRTEIGQAQGIIMERFGLDAEKAFATLRRLSQHQNIRLARVAADLVRTRAADGLAPSALRRHAPRR